MEQYLMPKKSDFTNLRYCIDNYTPDFLFIRLVGASGGEVKVRESLENKTLNFKKNPSGLYVLIDRVQVFHFPLKDYQKGFFLEYERIEPTADGLGSWICLSRGIDPYDPKLPEPRRSILRTALDNHLMEIFFKGRIDIKKVSQNKKSNFDIWTIDKK